MVLTQRFRRWGFGYRWAARRLLKLQAVTTNRYFPWLAGILVGYGVLTTLMKRFIFATSVGSDHPRMNLRTRYAAMVSSQRRNQYKQRSLR